MSAPRLRALFGLGFRADCGEHSGEPPGTWPVITNVSAATVLLDSNLPKAA
eukprot:CAMPEP_0114549536 /NCGR_PEP_ID=MMETSP0114-20121206/5576_1 /TAXON_ID=31324 /ORGANISM="Goniomonas sp, Strain m" /LENGTH=50 /DNA_ID=CAMNT_0001734217 /DNA_START=1077 /DNA_END=1226 /DNA_ORIENTATION=+